jgi:hypothetical protein
LWFFPRRASGVLLVLIFECFLKASADAGQVVGATTGAISGTVTDMTGAVAPNVTVVASSDAIIGSKGTPLTVTNQQGLYRLTDLAPGEYSLVFTLDGFGAQRREGIYVGDGFTATVNVELEIAKLNVPVTVERRSPVFNTQSTAIIQNFANCGRARCGRPLR